MTTPTASAKPRPAHPKYPYSQAWLNDLLCIHSGLKNARWTSTLALIPGTGVRVGWGEGSWTDNSTGQQGGVQMDAGFQHTYGAEFVARYGNASHWPARDQILAAWRAYHGYNGYKPRGFTPWPNTARLCGLL